MRKKHCNRETTFEHIWKHADNDGVWTGDAAIIAAEFGVSENEAHELLGELCDRELIQRVGKMQYIVVKWRERDDAGEEEVNL
jgi:predicted transcriptional regulator of viral defense system